MFRFDRFSKCNTFNLHIQRTLKRYFNFDGMLQRLTPIRNLAFQKVPDRDRRVLKLPSLSWPAVLRVYFKQMASFCKIGKITKRHLLLCIGATHAVLLHMRKDNAVKRPTRLVHESQFSRLMVLVTFMRYFKFNIIVCLNRNRVTKLFNIRERALNQFWPGKLVSFSEISVSLQAKVLLVCRSITSYRTLHFRKCLPPTANIHWLPARDVYQFVMT